ILAPRIPTQQREVVVANRLVVVGSQFEEVVFGAGGSTRGKSIASIPDGRIVLLGFVKPTGTVVDIARKECFDRQPFERGECRRAECPQVLVAVFSDRLINQ